MTELIEISFVAILIYLIVLIIRVVIAGFIYDVEKKKIDRNYDGNHSFGKIGGAMPGHFVIPWPIIDNDPNITQYVTKYNRLTKTFGISILIGVPLMIYLGGEINKL